MSKKKPLIVFEGIEGSGKSTLINYASQCLKSKKMKKQLAEEKTEP